VGGKGAAGKFAPAEKNVERFFPITRHLNRIGEVHLTQSVQGQFDFIGIVFNEENLENLLTHCCFPRLLVFPVGDRPTIPT